MPHVRRKFFEARDEDPESIETILAAIQRLYRIEREAKRDGLRGEELVRLRAGEPRRLLAVLGEYIERLAPTALPKSGLGTAITYARSQWPSITRYLAVPEAELDNNSCESAIRPLALGRKNWLFAGSQAGGHRAATLFSIVITCKRLGIDPHDYLADVLARLPTHKLSRIEELTPRAWQAARQQ